MRERKKGEEREREREKHPFLGTVCIIGTLVVCAYTSGCCY